MAPAPRSYTHFPSFLGPQAAKRKRSEPPDDQDGELATATYNPVGAEHRWKSQQGQLRRKIKDLIDLQSRYDELESSYNALAQQDNYLHQQLKQITTDLQDSQTQLDGLVRSEDAYQAFATKLQSQLTAQAEKANRDAILHRDAQSNTETRFKNHLAHLNLAASHRTAEIRRLSDLITQRDEECSRLREDLALAKQTSQREADAATTAKALEQERVTAYLQQREHELEAAMKQVALLNDQLAHAAQDKERCEELVITVNELEQSLVEEHMERSARETDLQNDLSAARAELAELRTAIALMEVEPETAVPPVQDQGTQASAQELEEENRMLRQEILNSRVVRDGRLALLEELAAMMRRDEANGRNGAQPRMFLLSVQRVMLIRWSQHLRRCT